MNQQVVMVDAGASNKRKSFFLLGLNVKGKKMLLDPRE